MNKIIYLLTGIIALCVINQSSFGQTSYGMFVGFSTPNSEINNIYNSNNLTQNDKNLGDFFRAGSKSGYNIGASIRFPLSGNFVFRGGIAIHRFPQTSIQVKDPTNGNLLATLNTTQNIVPITIGLNYYLFREFVGLYATGDLSYNYISSSVDVSQANTSVSLPIATSTTDNRVGFGVGAGADLDLKLILLNLEAKYNIANMIGQKPGESTKSYFSLTFGVYFGSVSAK